MEPVLTFQMKPIEKQTIAKTGSMSLSMTSYLLEMVLPGTTTSLIKVESQHSSPMSDDGVYINFNKALELSGLQENVLRELCSLGKIDARQMDDDWLILWDSLKRYLNKHRLS